MTYLVDVLYIFAFALFIYGLMGLTGPKTAVRGNWIAAAGMGITAGAASSQSQSNNAVPSRLEEEARLTPKHVRCESEGENGEVVCVLDDPLCWETQEVMRVPRDGLDHKMRHLHRG